MQDISYHSAVLLVNLHIPAAQSLKDKRMVVKSIKDRVRQYNVSVAELGNADKWQTCTLGFVAISNDNRYLDGILQNILSLIKNYPEAEICDHQVEIL